MRRPRLAITLAVVAHLLTWAVLLFFAFGPVYSGYSSSSDGGMMATQRSGLEVNGAYIFVPLMVPVVLTVIPVVTLRFTDRTKRVRGPLLWIPFVLLLGFCVLAVWSIGIFCLPSALMLLVAAITGRKERES
ncbi:MAG: hypothetical protein OXC55_07215 [Chloroflexi bacterium]|nr:hypothetical protein [Chloroflexota bacterium]